MEFCSDKDKYPNIHTLIRNDVLLKTVKEFYATTGTFPRILEYGCGLGGTIDVLKGCWTEYLAIDANPDVIAHLQKVKNYPKLEYRCCTDLVSVQQKYDIIICLSVLEHVEDDAQFLQSFFQRLENNGYLIAQVPAFQELFSIIDEYYGHYRRYDYQQLICLLSENGFIIKDFLSQGLRILWPYEIYKFRRAISGLKLDRQTQNLQSGVTQFSNLSKAVLRLKSHLYPFIKKKYERFCRRYISAGIEFLFVARKL